jgi:hypothetical protein
MAGADPNTWIKPAIQSILKESQVGHDAQVNVENVPYGTWIWDDNEKEHIHVTSKELKSSLGARGYAKLRRQLVRVALTWSRLREVAGR